MVKHVEKEACEQGASDVHARLISAACELIVERGYRGATTREIAQRAGVTEMTLFRHFSSKEALMQRSLEKGTDEMADMVPEPTGNLESDLLSLLDGYYQMWNQKMATTLEILPEMSRNPELLTHGIPDGIVRYRERLFHFFRYYQERGILIEESPEEATFAFVGPLFIRMVFSKSYGMVYSFDRIRHVHFFLSGRLIAGQ